MANKGRVVYVPKNVLNELDRIMITKNIKKKSVAFNQLVKYSRVGMEAERIVRLDFGNTFKKIKRRK